MCCTDTPDLIDRGPQPRTIIIAGLRWSVMEAPHRLDRRFGTELLFTCNTLVLRVRHYPASWRALSDEELWDLAWTQHEDDGRA